MYDHSDKKCVYHLRQFKRTFSKVVKYLAKAKIHFYLVQLIYKRIKTVKLILTDFVFIYLFEAYSDITAVMT